MTSYNKEIDDLIHSLFVRTRASLDGLIENDVKRSSAQLRKAAPVKAAYRRMIAVESEQSSPWTKFDDAQWWLEDAGPWIAGIDFLAILTGAVLGVGTLVANWKLPWVWFGIAAGLLLLANIGVAVAYLIVVRLGRKADEEFLRRSSRWPARRRAFESAVELLVYEPAARRAAKVVFRCSKDDLVSARGAALSTTPYSFQLVKTDTYRRVSLQISRPDGATIGIRGSRGAGKTDLVRSLCGEQEQPTEAHQDVDDQRDELTRRGEETPAVAARPTASETLQ